MKAYSTVCFTVDEENDRIGNIGTNVVGGNLSTESAISKTRRPDQTMVYVDSTETGNKCLNVKDFVEQIGGIWRG